MTPAAGRVPPPLLAPRQAFDGSPIYTVSDLTRCVRDAIEQHIGLVWVTGEVGNFRTPASGHCYFTLKDESAQIAVVMWRSVAERLRFQIAEGQSVLAQGDVTVYEPRGQYQLSVRRIEPLGVGALQLAFLQLKERLEKEGLFDAARKRPIPSFPRTIALVTSSTSAAVQDMLTVIRRRCPFVRVLLVPVRVQGEGAAQEIADAIALVNRVEEVEVMIVGRGGGSIEDLWPFNEEVVARAIAGSKVPVISAVGHETDFTISDFVADVRALTPTDAGNIVVPDVQHLAEDLDSLGRRLGKALSGRVDASRERLDSLALRCEPRRFLDRIRDREQGLDELGQRLVRDAQHAVEFQAQRLNALSGRIESLSPLAVLRRGYSLTLREPQGATVRNAAELRPGDLVRTRLSHGQFCSRVETVGGPEHGKKSSEV